MGGRRARSVIEVVGGGLSALRGRFSKAISEHDPEALAISSAKLLAQSEKTGDIVYYVSKLADFVRKTVESGRELSRAKRVKLARREWSRIKKKEGIPNDPIVTNAVVSAAAEAIGKSEK